MAYGKRRRFRRRRPRRIRRRSFTKRVRKVVHRMSELKFNAATSTANISISGAYYDMAFGIGQGAQSYNRIGVKVQPKWLRVYFQCIANNAIASDAYNTLRILVVRYKRGRPASFGDFLDAQTSSPTDIYLTTDPRNVVVLHERLVTINDIASGIGKNQVFGKISIPLRVPPIIFSTDAVDSTQNNSIFMLVTSDSAGIPHPVFTFRSIMSYRDY